MLTDAEKTAVRRYLGYPVFGGEQAGHGGWQFYTAYGTVEYRLNNLAASEVDALRGYLETLGTLERGVPDAAAGLDISGAAGWVRNPAELAERERLFDGWRRRFCFFLGLPPGPGLAGGGLTFVV